MKTVKRSWLFPTGRLLNADFAVYALQRIGCKNLAIQDQIFAEPFKNNGMRAGVKHNMSFLMNGATDRVVFSA